MGKMKMYDNKEVEWKECLGCEFANHEFSISCGIAYEDATFTLSQDWELPIPGFMIVSSKKHIISLSEFTDEERNKMTELLNSGFTDTFRYLYPDKENAYSWWSYMGHAREKNVGWRIDYFIVSKSIEERIEEAEIYSDIMGSDHCPVGIEIK